MRRLLIGLILVPALFAAGHSTADEARLSLGGDEFVAGQSATINQPAIQRDAFVAGYDVGLAGMVQGDAHLAGFNVRDDARVQGDIYAAGFSVDISGSIGGDLTAMGNTVNVAAAAPVSGNVRLAGSLVTVAAPVGGSGLITARNLTLDGPITGDLNFFGETITFGPNAKIGGKVTIQAPSAITVPDTVASADRVTFQQLVDPDYASQAGKTAEHVVRSFWPEAWAAGLWWLLLLVIGLAVLALSPRMVDGMRAATGSRPLRTLGLGVLAFAAVVGLVPVSAITLVGLLVTPVFILFAVVMCALAYLAGVYLLGDRLIGKLTKLDTLAKRTMGLALAIVVAGLLAMVPVLGWLVTLLLTVFGFGAIARLAIVRRTEQGRSEQPPPLQATATI